MSEATTGGRPRPYLFLLTQPSVEVRRQAAVRLRELGLRVVAQYGRVAVEALASTDRARAARDLGLFTAVLNGAMKDEHLERLTDEQRVVVRQWNVRFGADYREIARDRTRLGVSWGDPDVDPSPPWSPVEPEEFLALVEEYERDNDRTAWQSPDTDEFTDRPDTPLTGERFVEYERDLRRRLDDPTVAYHLARLAARLGPRDRGRIRSIDPDFADWVFARLFLEAACWEMTGEMSVGIVFVESSRDRGPAFGDNERQRICQEIIDGLGFLAQEHPSGGLSWVYDFQFTRIDAADGDEDACDGDVSAALEAGWRDPAMAQVTYNGTTYPATWSSVAAYREDMRTANRSAHAIVVFATPYANCWHAYAGNARLVLAKHNNWGNWGESALDRITAHEVSHLFGAADEYTGSGTPCSTCDSVHGCDTIPNGNCGACARPHQKCMMMGSHRRICAYTRGQIGWSTLFVELVTGDVSWAGTDDWVRLDIGNRSFDLDTSDHDDRERNNREGYPIWAPEVRREDIARVLIRKGPDGSNGGWRLGGLRVWHEGTLVCDEPAVNTWLEDDHRTWLGCVARSDLVNTLDVLVTTADVGWAGTDDDVTLTLAGHSWDLDNESHDDFERGHTDTFHLDPGEGLRVDDIHAVRIAKSSDGFAGGWKLGGVRIVANGTTVYDNPRIDQWLEDDHRTWSDTF